MGYPHDLGNLQVCSLHKVLWLKPKNTFWTFLDYGLRSKWGQTIDLESRQLTWHSEHKVAVNEELSFPHDRDRRPCAGRVGCFEFLFLEWSAAPRHMLAYET